MTSDVGGCHLPESLYGPWGCQRYCEINTPKSKVHHSDPRPDILSPWRQLLRLQIPCHVHWPRSYCRSRARTAVICRKPCFRDRLRMYAGKYVLGPCLRSGFRIQECLFAVTVSPSGPRKLFKGVTTACVRGAPAARPESPAVRPRRMSSRHPPTPHESLRRRSDALGAGRRCLAPRVGGGRWSRAARDRTDLGEGIQRAAGWAGRLSVFQRCGVGHAWTLGLVRRPVTLSGMLLRWPSGAFGSCIEGRWIKETFLTMRTLRVARS